MNERRKAAERLISAFQMTFPRIEGIKYEDGVTPMEMAVSEFGAYLRVFPYHLTAEEILEAYRMASRGELRDFLGNQIELYPNLKTAQAGKILMAYQDYKCDNQQHTLGIQKLKSILYPEAERNSDDAKAEKRKNMESLISAVKENRPCSHAFLFYNYVLKKGGLKKFVSDPIAQKIVIKKKMHSILWEEKMKTKSVHFNKFEIIHLSDYFKDENELLNSNVKFAFEKLKSMATTLVKNDLVYNWLKKQIKNSESRNEKLH